MKHTQAYEGSTDLGEGGPTGSGSCRLVGDCWSRRSSARPVGRSTSWAVLKAVTATAVGILSASPGLDATIRAYAAGAVAPRPLVAATVSLDEVGPVLAGERPADAGPGPKIHVGPRQRAVDGSARRGGSRT